MTKLAPPKLITVIFNSTCNYYCVFCAHRIYEKQSYSWSFEQIKSLESLYKTADVINIGGVGELSAIPYFEDVLKYFTNLGKSIVFSSNGYKLNPEMIRKYMIEEIIISLHSLNPETYNYLTGTEGRLPIVIEHTKALAVKPRQYKLFIVSVVTNRNVKESADLAQFVVDIGADGLKLLPLAKANMVGLEKYEDGIPLIESIENINSVKKAVGIIDSNKLQEYHVTETKTRIKNISEQMKTCFNPFKQILINMYGDILPCCFIHHSFGNIFKQSWEEVWNGEEYNKFREEVRAGTCDLCKNCLNWG